MKDNSPLYWHIGPYTEHNCKHFQIMVLGVNDQHSTNYTFCDGYEPTGSTSDSRIKGVIFSPNYDTGGSYGIAGNSVVCQLNIKTPINRHHHSLTTFEMITHEDRSSGGPCLLDMLTGSGDQIVDVDFQQAKAQSGSQGITLKLNNESQHQPDFHIKYEGKSLKFRQCELSCFLSTKGYTTLGSESNTKFF